MRTAEEIERIVQLVIRRLVAAPTGESAPGSQVLELKENVITMVTLAGKLTGVRRLLVDARAVVTPSVQDELREREIVLERRNPAIASKGSSSSLLLANLGSVDVQAVLRDSVSVHNVPSSSVETAVEAIEKRLRGSGRGLLICDAPEKAVCLANRHRHIFAFAAHDVAGIQRTMAGLPANLLVLENNDGYAIRSFTEAFLACPAGRS